MANKINNRDKIKVCNSYNIFEPRDRQHNKDDDNCFQTIDKNVLELIIKLASKIMMLQSVVNTATSTLSMSLSLYPLRLWGRGIARDWLSSRNWGGAPPSSLVTRGRRPFSCWGCMWQCREAMLPLYLGLFPPISVRTTIFSE